MVVIAVGDFDPNAVEKLITSTFAPLQPRGPNPKETDLGKITAFSGVRANFHAEAEAAATSVSISSLSPYPNEPDTAAQRMRDLPRDLALSILNRRFSVLAKKENAPFVSAFASVGDEFRFYREASVNVECKPEQWSAALAVGEQELRRALEHGFQVGEFKEVVANYTNGLEQAVKT